METPALLGPWRSRGPATADRWPTGKGSSTTKGLRDAGDVLRTNIIPYGTGKLAVSVNSGVPVAGVLTNRALRYVV